MVRQPYKGVRTAVQPGHSPYGAQYRSNLRESSLTSTPCRMIAMSRVLVIGSTGTVGREVVSQLQVRGAEVTALARNPKAVRFPSEVELVRGDLTVPESLETSLDGIDAVFLVWTAPPATVAPVLERIAKHARRIVFLSAPLKTSHPFFQQPNPARALPERIERLIETSGLEWTFLRPGMFASNASAWWAPQIRAGDVVRWPHLAAPTAPIDERDIAAVGVRALCDDGHAGAEYVLTGPQSLSQFEQLSTIGRATGRYLRIEEMSPDDARREWAPILGLPPSSICCSTPGLPQSVYLRSLHPHSKRSQEHGHGHSTSGPPITLPTFERDFTFATEPRPGQPDLIGYARTWRCCASPRMVPKRRCRTVGFRFGPKWSATRTERAQNGLPALHAGAKALNSQSKSRAYTSKWSVLSEVNSEPLLRSALQCPLLIHNGQFFYRAILRLRLGTMTVYNLEMASANQVRGVLLEEAILMLLRASGYRTVTSAAADETLFEGPAGLNVRGRGGRHQIDAIADLRIGQPFSNPQRLLVEAKAYSNERKVGLPIVRGAVGVLKDVSEFWVKDGPNQPAASRYHYQFAIFSTSEFTSDAQDYAFAHDVHLLPLRGSSFFSPVVKAIEEAVVEMPRRRGLEVNVEVYGVRQALRERLQSNQQARRGDDFPWLAGVVSATRGVGVSLIATLGMAIPVFLTPRRDLNLNESPTDDESSDSFWACRSRG